MARIHLYITAEQLEPGGTVEAQCGAVIKDANMVPITDFMESESPRSSVIFCRKCFSRNYFYAVTDGQNAIDLEAGVSE